MSILTEIDTFLGSTAYRNGLITREQLGEAVELISRTPGQRLGEALVSKGYLTAEQVEAILVIQRRQREILQERTPPTPPMSAPAEPPTPPAAPRPADASPGPSIPSAASTASIQSTPSVAATPLPAKLEHLADFLAYVRAAGASDLHISSEVRPFLRLHGAIVPLDVPPLSADDAMKLLFEVLSEEQIARLIDQQSLESCLEIPGHGRSRANLYKQRLGWDGTFHVIRDRAPSFEELGLPDCLVRLTEYTQGLVLVTGPGKSGKTTTLAALIDMINRTRADHIITIERPVEYAHAPQQCQVTQREVRKHTNSFAVALRAALREDPDVIMVGELRDHETLSTAISAAETGDLVFSTLHTTSAARTVIRIVDGFPVGQQAQIRMMLSESLRGIISQQLVRRNDGQGQALALEILFVTPPVAAVLRDDKPFQIPSIMQTLRKMGMRRLDDSLLELAQAGVIDTAEARRQQEGV
ncbi:MAG: PilT/PilU family type 4a pilus ATPase [Candidatus Sumerlaeota bacterium]|nr:PilT/PilU family type 4a pilus ATPase [Candidatus Sumerlaeota bacterium]